MAKHPTRSTVRNIAEGRTARLAALAEEAVREGREDRAVRYVEIAKAVCAKSQTHMPEGFVYCKECLLPLVPGVNCTVRLTGHKVVSSCPRCGTVRRMPYIREQKARSAEREASE
ncbi:MAG: ribonuclease P protein component 4 [Methanomethylophilus sp.]